jgi:DNA replication protein DnaC
MRAETAELLLDSVTKRLKLPTIRQQFRSLAREAEERNLSYEAYLLALLEQEVLVRKRTKNSKNCSVPHSPSAKPWIRSTSICCRG